MNLKTLIADFAGQLTALIHSQATERARATVLSAFGVAPRRGPGRPPKAAAARAKAAAPVATRARKKAPRQLCPVPGCKNSAAPIFGMVCADHKSVPKAKIKAFREARRAKKLGLPVPKTRKRRVAKKPAAQKPSPKKPAAKKAPKKRAKPVVTAPATTAAPAEAA